jgi:glycolate oxidase iron-sulfur subunit
MDVLNAASAWDPHHPPDPELIRDCVHCGFCLPTCPSYTVFSGEMDSPRGRIVLMRLGHEPGATLSADMRLHFDRCLGCMACVTACPSGVQYDRLIEQVRPQLERHVPRRWRDRAFVAAVLGTFTRPGAVRALTPLLVLQRRLRLRSALTRVPLPRMRALASLAPQTTLRAAFTRLPEFIPASRTVAPRGPVVFMQGCVQRALFADVNAATVRVLAAEGFEVQTLRRPRCCGALKLHSGLERPALELAKATIAAYEALLRRRGEADGTDGPFIAVNVAGCGSAMKDYGRLLADDASWAQRARAFSAKVRDVHELLGSAPAQAPRHPIAMTVAYHDACHLAHAQRIRREPRDLLRTIPDLTLVEPPEWELCCGSAGIYNVTQPAAAATLGRRKVANLLGTGANAIAAANPGCALQIAANAPPGSIRVFHPMTLLDHSIRGAQP